MLFTFSFNPDFNPAPKLDFLQTMTHAVYKLPTKKV